MGPVRWFNRVRPGGEWDYKRKYGPEFEDFGNFNFGATGAALGIPEEVLLRGAAGAHLWERSGSGKGEFSILPGGGEYPYGDDPRDAAQIQAGIRYYEIYETKQFQKRVLQVRGELRNVYKDIRSFFGIPERR